MEEEIKFSLLTGARDGGDVALCRNASGDAEGVADAVVIDAL